MRDAEDASSASSSADATTPAGPDPQSTTQGDGEPKMSKNKMKKLAKQQKQKDTRKEWREKEKAKKKAKKRQMKEQGLAVKKKKKRIIEDHEYQGNAVIDLSFCDLMTSKEVQSLSRQLLHTYAANNRAARPMRIHLTGCKDEVLQVFRNQHDGFDNWPLKIDSRSYMDIFPKQDLVYLTSDTDNVMSAVDTNKVYIIGGIVDHNRLKNITVNRANEQGIATAQLPIGDFIEMKSRKVLAVNHVFEILVNVANNGGDWASALETTLPSRKEFSVKGKGKEEKNEDDGDEEDAKESGEDDDEDEEPSETPQVSTSISNDGAQGSSSTQQVSISSGE